eukprot:jgi/Astpho2/3953/fgenesh1_pg.00063_%23_19_t
MAASRLQDFRDDAWCKIIGAFEFLQNSAHIIRERYSRTSCWLPDADFTGQTCIVTGGNAGCGLAIARELYMRGGHDIEQLTPLSESRTGHVEVAPLDLGSLRSVRDFADSFNERCRPLDLLICNAGIMAPPQRQETCDGLEQHFQVNFLGHWLLVNALLDAQDRMRRKGKYQRRDSERGTRVLFVSSMTHRAGRVRFDDLQSQKRYRGFRAYADSKLMNLMNAKELERRLERQQSQKHQQDTIAAVHPGLIDTDLARSWMRNGCPRPLRRVLHPLLDIMFPFILLPPRHAAATLLWAASAPHRMVHGQYVEHSRVARPSSRALDSEVAGQLWDVACSLTETA